MNKYSPSKDHLVLDQVNAAVIDSLNERRIHDEFIQLSAQDSAFYRATEQVDNVRDFIARPNHILGSDLTKHGEIAEQVEVGIRNARSVLHHQEPLATFDGVGRTAPEDYLINGIDVQSKFINGENNNLDHVLNHMDKYINFGRDESYYHIPKDTYETILRVKNGLPVDELNERSKVAILAKVDLIESESGKPFEEVVNPGLSTYREVQIGKVDETLDNHQNDLMQENLKIKDQIHQDHEPSLEDGIYATEAAAAVVGAISLGTSIYSKYKEGKNLFKGDFSAEDWKEIGITTTKCAVGGAITGGAIYLLTNNAALSAPFAGAIVSGTKGVASLVKDYNAGKITFDEFMNSGLSVCTDSAIIGLATAAGQTLIPIPILGAVIGSLAGKIFAELATTQAGKITHRIQQEMDDFMAGLDTVYRNLINQINMEFDRLGKLTEAAFDFEHNLDLVTASIDLAREYGVPEDKIIHNHDELDTFMIG